MNALKLTLIASLLAFSAAHAAGDELQVETIVVTAKRPAFVVTGETMLVVTVTAPAPITLTARVIPEVVIVRPEDSLVIEPPQHDLAIVLPKLEPPKLSLAPPRTALALADVAETKG